MACAGYDDVVLTLVFELLEEVDLCHCCLTCRRWNYVAKREEDARVKRDEARRELLRSEWEQQHSDWETTRAQLSQDVCSDLDKELCNTFFDLLDLTDQEEISVILVNMEDLYKRGAGTFHFHRSFCSCDNLDALAAECVIKIVTRMNFEIDEPAAARVLQKAIGMGLAAKGSQVCAQVGPIHPLPSEVLRILGGDRLSLFSDVYYIGYLEAIFETLLEPMAVVSSDFALEWDIDMLTFLFGTTDRPMANRLLQQRTIKLLLWSGIGYRPTSIWKSCKGCTTREKLCRSLSRFLRLFWSSEFLAVFMHERSTVLREEMIDHVQRYHSNDFLQHAKSISPTRRGRKGFAKMLDNTPAIRNLILGCDPVSGLFELARMHERGILKVFLKTESRRVFGLRDIDGNCLLLYAAGCRGLTSGLIADLLAFGFDPHLRNLQGQTACDRYRGVLRRRSKLRICLRNEF
jgi:F-box-like